jgi:hypothetical protein
VIWTRTTTRTVFLTFSVKQETKTAFLKRKVIIQFLLASLKALTNTENCSKIWPCMYSVENLPMRAKERQNRKMIKLLEQYSGSQVAFGTTSRVMGGNRKPEQVF